jgi:hypothetical protein
MTSDYASSNRDLDEVSQGIQLGVDKLAKYGFRLLRIPERPRNVIISDAQELACTLLGLEIDGVNLSRPAVQKLALAIAGNAAN